jgi:hypothetical protein
MEVRCSCRLAIMVFSVAALLGAHASRVLADDPLPERAPEFKVLVRNALGEPVAGALVAVNEGLSSNPAATGREVTHEFTDEEGSAVLHLVGERALAMRRLAESGSDVSVESINYRIEASFPPAAGYNTVLTAGLPHLYVDPARFAEEHTDLDYPEDIDAMRWELEDSTPHELEFDAATGNDLKFQMPDPQLMVVREPAVRPMQTPMPGSCGTEYPRWIMQPSEDQELEKVIIPVADVYSANDGTVSVTFSFGKSAIAALTGGLSSGLDGQTPANDWIPGNIRATVMNEIGTTETSVWPVFAYDRRQALADFKTKPQTEQLMCWEPGEPCWPAYPPQYRFRVTPYQYAGGPKKGGQQLGWPGKLDPALANDSTTIGVGAHWAVEHTDGWTSTYTVNLSGQLGGLLTGGFTASVQTTNASHITTDFNFGNNEQRPVKHYVFRLVNAGAPSELPDVPKRFRTAQIFQPTWVALEPLSADCSFSLVQPRAEFGSPSDWRKQRWCRTPNMKPNQEVRYRGGEVKLVEGDPQCTPPGFCQSAAAFNGEGVLLFYYSHEFHGTFPIRQRRTLSYRFHPLEDVQIRTNEG